MRGARAAGRAGRPQRRAGAIAWALAGLFALAAACDSGDAPGPLIELGPAEDAGVDMEVDAGLPCDGFPLDCAARAAGAPGCCDTMAIDAVCTGGVWTCPGGSIPASDCMFFAPDPVCL